MRSLPSFAALALGASLIALPALAATSPEQPNAPGANGSMAVNGTGNNGEPHQGTMANNGTWNNAEANKSPAQRNPLLTDQGDVRISRLIGAEVYNEHDQDLGSVADVVMGNSGTPEVIVQTDGKLHAVPWNKLRFGNAARNADNKVLLPDGTKNALNGKPRYHYANRGNG